MSLPKCACLIVELGLMLHFLLLLLEYWSIILYVIRYLKSVFAMPSLIVLGCFRGVDGTLKSSY